MASLSPWMEKMIDKTIQMLQNDVLKKKIQILILQPFLQYIIELLTTNIPLPIKFKDHKGSVASINAG